MISYETSFKMCLDFKLFDNIRELYKITRGGWRDDSVVSSIAVWQRTLLDSQCPPQ